MIASSSLQSLVVVAIVSSICAPLLVLYVTNRLNEARLRRQQVTAELTAARLADETRRVATVVKSELTAAVKGELKDYLATDNGHTPGQALAVLEDGHADMRTRLDRIEVKLDDHIALTVQGEP